MTVVKSGEHDRNINQDRPWELRDYLLLGIALGSAVLSRNEHVGAVASSLLDLFAGSLGAAYLVGFFDKGQDLKNAKESARKARVLNGVEPIVKEGEQLVVLSGNGSFLVNHMVANNPEHMIPMFNSVEAAQVLRRLLGGNTEFQYLNLEVADDAMTVVDTPNLELLVMKHDNALHTLVEDKIVTVSVGSVLPSIYKSNGERINHDAGIGHAESTILHSRLVEQFETIVRGPDNSITIRVDQMYDYPGNRPKGNVNNNVRSDWETCTEGSKNMGRSLLLDPWTVVMRSIFETAVTIPGSSVDPRVCIVLDSDSLPIALPYASDFEMTMLGKARHNSSVQGVRDFFHGPSERKRVMVNLVMEREDKDVLATLMTKQGRITTDQEEMIDLAKQEDIYVFQTEDSARIARGMGALNVVCIAECVNDVIKQIVAKIKTGESMAGIQLWIDEQHSHKKIIDRLDNVRLQADKDRLDILDALDEVNDVGWWSSLADKIEKEEV